MKISAPKLTAHPMDIRENPDFVFAADLETLIAEIRSEAFKRYLTQTPQKAPHDAIFEGLKAGLRMATLNAAGRGIPPN